MNDLPPVTTPAERAAEVARLGAVDPIVCAVLTRAMMAGLSDVDALRACLIAVARHRDELRTIAERLVGAVDSATIGRALADVIGPGRRIEIVPTGARPE